MPKKILIIDDDPVIVKYLQAVFSDNGYATCSRHQQHGGIGGGPAGKTRPDHPGHPDARGVGPRFYRKLRQDKELREIPVIVISGIDGDHAVKDAVAFVKKPFDPEQLVGIVKNTIG